MATNVFLTKPASTSVKFFVGSDKGNRTSSCCEKVFEFRDINIDSIFSEISDYQDYDAKQKPLFLVEYSGIYTKFLIET